MKALIENNEIAVANLEVSAIGKISDLLVVRRVRPTYKKDDPGKMTDLIESVRYDCVDPDNFATLTIKVIATSPVITNELIENSDEPVYISVPVDQTVIRPYEISYGKAKVSIVAPSVKLAEN